MVSAANPSAVSTKQARPASASVRPISIYWHIFAKPGAAYESRLDEILTRQLSVLEDSGLLANSSVHIGLVGAGRSPGVRGVLRHGAVVEVQEFAAGYKPATSA